MRRICAYPASNSARQLARPARGGASSGTRSRAVATAATTNVAASTTATAPPPARANSPAPASGATRRPDSCRPSRQPLTRCRRSCGSIWANSASSAGPLSTSCVPYQVITQKMIQVHAADRTASSGRSAIADTRLSRTSRRRRATRSAAIPASGPNSDGR